MTQEEGDYCLSCDSREGFDHKKGMVNLFGWRDQKVHVVICHNCGYMHMYKTMRKKRKKRFSEE